MEGACLPRESEHLTPAEAEMMARGQSQDALLREHLELCSDCRGEVEGWRDWIEKVRLLQRWDDRAGGSGCPPPEELASFAAGLDEPGSERLIEHVASCDRCGAILRETSGEHGEADELLSSLRTGTPEWRTWMAARFVQTAKKQRRSWKPWLAAAAGILIAIASGLWWQHREQDPQRLLAAAYTAARPFEYRLRDEGYGRARAQRGGEVSTFDRPESLGRAVAEIQRRLQAAPERPDLLELKGRAELLEGEFDSAIADLTRASELAPSVEADEDLGAAYALSGDAHQRNGDYGHAVNLLLEALRLEPRNVKALFNLAIVYERLSMLDAASSTWQKLLAIENRGPWADEARTRLEDVEKKKNARKGELKRIPEDPKAFLAARRNGDGEYDAENLQNVFWSRWLPNARRDREAAGAGRRIAEDWLARFGDRLLKDAVEEAAKTDADDLLQAAGLSIVENIHGGNDKVLARAERLIADLETRGQRAAAMRMSVELAYSYRRSTRHEPCLAITGRLLKDLDGREYRWLAGRTHIEHSVCMSRAGGMGPARREREETAEAARANGLASLALQADQMVTSIDALSGNSSAVWAEAPKGLAVYWASAAPEARAQQGLYDMALAARTMGWKEAAIGIEGWAVEAVNRWGNPEVEALNRVHLASLFEEAGHHEEAVAELDRAEALFRRQPQGTTVANLMLAAQLRKAQAEALGPHPEKALMELTELAKLPNFSSLADRMDARQTEGIALRARGDWQAAQRCFREAIRLGGEQVRSFAHPLSRIAAAEMAIESRRNLVEIALLHDRDAAEALRIWEARWTDLAPANMPVISAAAAAGSDAMLTYVTTPSGTAAFVSTKGRVQGRLLDQGSAPLEAEIREFQRRCASPSSDPAVLRADGRKLYARLVEPFAREIAGAPRILIASDRWISSLPFAALVDESGRYLAERHAVGVISGPGDAGSPLDPGVSTEMPAVILAAPRAGAKSRLPFLTGATREAKDLADRMTRPVLLESSTEAPDAIARRMATGALVHFAGHGWSNGGNAALILGPDANGGNRYLTAMDLAALDWKGCRLAVLSACLTAAGEDRGPVNPQSLVRALLSGGARRVVAARWSLDAESTPALMRQFYDSLFAGSPPVVALAEASAKVRSMRGWEHPYYWAAFDVFGAP
jgi:CHAT domain-containing protein